MFRKPTQNKKIVKKPAQIPQEQMDAIDAEFRKQREDDEKQIEIVNQLALELEQNLAILEPKAVLKDVQNAKPATPGKRPY